MIKGIIIIKFDLDTPYVMENEQIAQPEENIDEPGEEEEEVEEEDDDDDNEEDYEEEDNENIIPKLEKWEIYNEYYADKKDKPKNDILESIMKSFIATVTLDDLNFRAYPYKFYLLHLIL